MPPGVRRQRRARRRYANDAAPAQAILAAVPDARVTHYQVSSSGPDANQRLRQRAEPCGARTPRPDSQPWARTFYRSGLTATHLSHFALTRRGSDAAISPIYIEYGYT